MEFFAAFIFSVVAAKFILATAALVTVLVICGAWWLTRVK